MVKKMVKRKGKRMSEGGRAEMPPVAGMQRMKKGGLVKGCGCASRGVKKAKYS